MVLSSALRLAGPEDGLKGKEVKSVMEQLPNLLPMTMVVCVGVGVYILLRTRWADEPAGKKRESGK